VRCRKPPCSGWGYQSLSVTWVNWSPLFEPLARGWPATPASRPAKENEKTENLAPDAFGETDSEPKEVLRKEASCRVAGLTKTQPAA